MKTQKTISFDFDDTICLWDGYESGCELNTAIKDLIWAHKNAGDKVILITRRDPSTKKDVLEAFKEWDIPIDADDTYFTGHTYKAWMIAKLANKGIKVDAHHDDDDDELATIEHHIKNIELFHVTKQHVRKFRE